MLFPYILTSFVLLTCNLVMETPAFPTGTANFTALLEIEAFAMDILEVNSSAPGLDGQNGFPNGNNNFSGNGNRTWPPKYYRPRSFPKSATFEVVRILSYYLGPLIIVVGILYNILAYLVFTRTRLRKVPSVPYLAAMAVVDSGALFTELVQIVLPQHGVFLMSKPGVCQYITYLNFVFIFLSMWYPVALCVEKFISVCCPLRKSSLCTPFRAKIVVIAMAIMSGVSYYHVIYMVGRSSHSSPLLACTTWSEFKSAFNIYMHIDLIIVYFLPCIALIVLMVLICIRGCEYYRISSAATEVTCRTTISRTGSSGSPVRVTNVVFPVVLFMLLLKMPVCSLRFFGFISRGRTPLQLAVDLQPVFLFIARLDWAIKFFIYFVFSASFRKSCKSFVCNSLSRCRYRCQRSSSVEETAGVITPCLNLAERTDGTRNTGRCLVASDV